MGGTTLALAAGGAAAFVGAATAADALVARRKARPQARAVRSMGRPGWVGSGRLAPNRDGGSLRGCHARLGRTADAESSNSQTPPLGECGRGAYILKAGLWVALRFGDGVDTCRRGLWAISALAGRVCTTA